MLDLSARTVVAVAALPSPTPALAGVILRLDGDDKPYWCDGAAWIDLSGAGVSIGEGAPSTPPDGALWWNTDTGSMYIRHNDGTSTQWVEIASKGSKGDTGDPGITVSATPPASPVLNQLWLEI